MGLPLPSSDRPISSFPQTHQGSDPKTVARTEALTPCQRSRTIPGPRTIPLLGLRAFWSGVGAAGASHPGSPGWAGRPASCAGPCAPWDSSRCDCFPAAVGSARSAEAWGDPRHVPGILTNMKKLKTNIRYFMQLRQSPSMAPPAKQRGSSGPHGGSALLPPAAPPPGGPSTCPSRPQPAASAVVPCQER